MKHAKEIIQRMQMFDVCPHIEKAVKAIVRQPIRIRGDEYHHVFIWCTKCHKGFAMPDSWHFEY